MAAAFLASAALLLGCGTSGDVGEHVADPGEKLQAGSTDTSRPEAPTSVAPITGVSSSTVHSWGDDVLLSVEIHPGDDSLPCVANPAGDWSYASCDPLAGWKVAITETSLSVEGPPGVITTVGGRLRGHVGSVHCTTGIGCFYDTLASSPVDLRAVDFRQLIDPSSLDADELPAEFISAVCSSATADFGEWVLVKSPAGDLILEYPSDELVGIGEWLLNRMITCTSK